MPNLTSGHAHDRDNLKYYHQNSCSRVGMQGTLDAMLYGSLWDPEDEVKANVKAYVDEVRRLGFPQCLKMFGAVIEYHTWTGCPHPRAPRDVAIYNLPAAALSEATTCKRGSVEFGGPFLDRSSWLV